MPKSNMQEMADRVSAANKGYEAAKADYSEAEQKIHRNRDGS